MFTDVTVHLLTWNDEWLLPQTLQHYHTAAQIVVHDNESTDQTVAIAQAYPRTRVESWGSGDLFDNVAMTAVQNTCWWGDRTPWSLTAATDEFLLVEPGVLARYTGQVVAFQAEGWQMVGVDGQPLDEIARGYRDTKFDKVVLFSPQAEGIHYTTGAHAAFPTCPVVRATTLRHYNLLGEDYVVARWKRNGSRMCAADRRRRRGFHYQWSPRTIRKLYQRRHKHAVDVPSLRALCLT